MELWTLGELAERVESALADYPGQANGRVRAVPDQRAIRWYTTTGLIDRPTEMRGRTALYSHRHLLQLVAIKRRQSQGRTLAEIQSELTGATNETLHPIAGLPATPSAPVNGSADAAGTASADAAGTASADAAAAGIASGAGDGSSGDPADSHFAGSRQSARSRFWADHQHQPSAAASPREAAPATDASAALVAAIRLTTGVTVVLDHPGPVADPARLAAAAAPLLAELTRQGLVTRSSGDER
ncbi:MerR family transcriptional regulator [Kribbella sp. CA-293567]|uniref:MerR family transcriptional regulator n=1 Tax=Kribbella sp. CA-293567 TaxID=3002436 RepID=UPI0022DD900A|nr:MerR family transcriptional regulator [Kribbella sp. CA-293567]WBQ04776.1 MerR family transcriptional regulator [Kribbella sp. CA-293567]